MIGRAAYENPFMLNEVDSRFYNRQSFVESKDKFLMNILNMLIDKLKMVMT